MNHSTNDRTGDETTGDETTGDDGRGLDTIAQDLKATEDSIRTDLGRLTQVEAEKQSVDPGDPRVDTLSDEAVELAARIHRQTRAERQLSEAIG